MKTNCLIGKKRLFTFLLISIFLCFFSQAQIAQFATKGTGSMRNYICWFDWAGTSVANNTSKTFTTPDGLTVKVTFTNVSGSRVTPYVMNTWSGAVLWQLYDFSDPLVMPALFSQGTINPASFAMNISVTRSGVPTPFTFVAADAEASAASEVTKINTSGTPWRTIEFFRNSSQTSNPLTGCGTQTVNLSLTYGDAPETGQNPILATDANGSLVVTTTMNRTEQGGMALAFGIFAPVDRGDLPFPYPQAQHGLRFTTKNSCNFNAPFPTIMQDASLRLGSVAGDADGSQTLDDNAAGVDEDAVSSFPPYNGSGSYTIPVSLRNITGAAAYLTGWFDYNRDENFTSNETVAVTVPNGATSASLTWTGLPSSLPQGTLSDFGFRFRLSSNATETQSAGGYARDGEVEDYLIDKKVIVPQDDIRVSFTAPDTVCVNTPVNITNTSVGASSYYWNFCVADVNTPPVATNLGNPGGYFSQPVFIDMAEDNGNYFGFVVNHIPGGITRLDFGNSLLNTPSPVFLGNISNVMNTNYGNEGIQIIKNNGKWYGILVGGSPASGTTPKLITIYFGTSLNNPAPTAVDWGNLGDMLEPVDLHVFQENGNWYGFTVNAENNTITRFNFTNSFDNPPTAINLGNIGDLNYPTGVYAVNDNGFWRVFVTNGNAGNSNLTRLDFGTSLLNTPTGINLGNPGNLLSAPRDITLIRYCGQTVGFVVNGTSDKITKLNFSSLTDAPTATSLGNLGSLNFPHSLSKLFRVGNDIYSFITNVSNNTMTRLKFTGCTSSSIPNSTAQNPPPIVYNTPGVYNINLSVDDGLPTQSSYCKQVVVLAPPTHSPTKTLTICKGGSVKIGSNVKSAGYSWSTGETTDSITITSTGTYWVESGRYGCSVRDSFIATPAILPPIDFGFEQNICSPKVVRFTSDLPANRSFQWYFGDGQSSNNNQTPTVNYADYRTYNVMLKVQYDDGCTDSLEKPVIILNIVDQDLILNTDTTICIGDSILLRTNDSILNYCWQTTDGNNPSTLNAYVKPTSPVTYVLSGAVVGKNLVSNGDFSLGNSGFISDYVFAAANNTEGQYWVGTNPNAWNTSLSRCSDHTTGNGNMMTVNGSPSPNAKVWSQTVAVTPNTNYTFATWIQSLISTNPAHLQFSINNVNLGNSVDANANPCQWNLFTSTWNSGSATTAIITIVNDNTTIAGNDFALDDIFFGTVTTKTDSLTVNVTGMCDSIKIAGLDKVCSKTDTVTYSIYRSAGCTQPYSVVVDNSFVDMVSQSANSLKLVFKQNGSILVKVGFNNGCKIVMDSVLVAVKFSPGKIDLGPDVTTCKDTLFTLNAPGGFESYQWQDGSTDSTFTVNGAGNYLVLAENFCNNQFKDSFKLIKTFPSPFAMSPLNAAVCKGDSVQFSASGGSTYTWQPAGEFNDAGSASPKAAVKASQNFSVQISDPFCGRDTLIVIPVVAKERADISILKKNDVNCQLDSTQLIANGGIAYTWSPNLYITRSTSNQITVKPPQTITYHVEGKDAGGCVGQDSVTVYFNKEGEQKLYVPNAFTPNNDGLNDIFRPIFTGPATKFDFRIFNRWGQLIFQTSTPNEGWNGMFKRAAQPKDVYVYYITAEGGCNGMFERKGTFVLIK